VRLQWLTFIYTDSVRHYIRNKEHLSTKAECNMNLFPGSQSPGATCRSLQCVSVEAACGCAPQSIYPVRTMRGNEQIAMTLLRLRHDMVDVQHRLHALEELTRSQVRGRGG